MYLSAAPSGSCRALAGDRHGRGVVPRVCERDRDRRLPGELRRPAVQTNPRRLPRLDLDFLRRNPLTERLDHSLLGREAGREMTAGPGTVARVGELAGGEEPIGESWAPFEGALNALNLDQVDTDGTRHVNDVT